MSNDHTNRHLCIYSITLLCTGGLLGFKLLNIHCIMLESWTTVFYPP